MWFKNILIKRKNNSNSFKKERFPTFKYQIVNHGNGFFGRKEKYSIQTFKSSFLVNRSVFSNPNREISS